MLREDRKLGDKIAVVDQGRRDYFLSREFAPQPFTFESAALADRDGVFIRRFHFFTSLGGYFPRDIQAAVGLLSSMR